GRVNPLFASTVGLLHNIGESLALHVRSASAEAAPLVDCVDPAALGAAVLAGWRLPERVYRVVEQQDLPEILLPSELDGHADEIGVLYVARACHQELLGDGTPMPHVSEYMARIGLDDTNLASFCRQVVRPTITR